MRYIFVVLLAAALALLTPTAPQAQSLPEDGVRRVQSLLTDMGYPTAIDGVPGPGTRRALAAFYADTGGPQNVRIDSNALFLVQRWHDREYFRADAAPARRTSNTRVAPSFDCARAGTQTEKAICRYDRLAELDRTLADTYTAFQGQLNADGRARLRAEQKSWLARRDACRADFLCLERAYEQRLQDFATGQ